MRGLLYASLVPRGAGVAALPDVDKLINADGRLVRPLAVRVDDTFEPIRSVRNWPFTGESAVVVHPVLHPLERGPAWRGQASALNLSFVAVSGQPPATRRASILVPNSGGGVGSCLVAILDFPVSTVYCRFQRVCTWRLTVAAHLRR